MAIECHHVIEVALHLLQECWPLIFNLVARLTVMLYVARSCTRRRAGRRTVPGTTLLAIRGLRRLTVFDVEIIVAKQAGS